MTTDDLYAFVISTNLAATSSAVWLMASLTLSGWLRGESIRANHSAYIGRTISGKVS